MAKLNPDSGFEPQAARARSLLEERKARFSTPWPRAVAAATVVAICVLTFPAPRAFAQKIATPCVEACENLVLNPGEIHAHLYGLLMMIHECLGFPPPSIKAESRRQDAPDFELADATGETFHLSDYRGRVVLLNFWASWCDPCKQEMPWFTEFQRTRADKGFVVIGVSMDEDGWRAVRPLMAALKINYRVAIGDDALAKKYGGIDTLPETLLIDREGRIAARHTSIVPKHQYELEIDHVIGKGMGTT